MAFALRHAQVCPWHLISTEVGRPSDVKGLTNATMAWSMMFPTS
jgi:hypothetical protein